LNTLSIFADESHHGTWDAFFRFLIPHAKNGELSLFLGGGFGYNFDFLDNVLSPGLYIDIGCSGKWITFFSSLSDNADEKGIQSDNENIGKDWGIISDLRLYNQLRWRKLEINPFWGYSMVFLQNDPSMPPFIINQLCGVRFMIDKYGLEYVYSFQSVPLRNNNFHQINLILHIKTFSL
jgi:hypothetical protein